MKKNNLAFASAALGAAFALAACSGGSGTATQEGNSSFYRPKNLVIHTMAGASTKLIRVLNQDDSLTTCTASASGTLSGCSIQDVPGADVIHQMAVNPRTGSMYFLQYGADSVLICNGANGALSSCAPATGGGNFKDPAFIALNADGTKAYIANEDDTLTVCQIAGDGTFSSCTATNVNGTLGTPVAVRLASGAYGTHAYFLNGETKPVITACTLAPSGMPSACRAEGGGGTFTAPTTIAFSPNGKYAYIGNFDNSVAICNIENDASLSSCRTVDTGGQELFAGIQEIAVDAAGVNAYVVNARSSRITHCKLTAGGANFADCSPYGIEDFQVTTDLALAEDSGSRTLFITSLSNNSIYGCALDANGGFGGSCIGTRILEQ